MSNGYGLDVGVLPGYLVAVVLICMAPGPDMAYMVGTGIAGGRAAATRAALGVTLGVVAYAVVVAAGLGSVVSDHPVVLTTLQVFGCVYLIWLAGATFRDARHSQPSDDPAAGARKDWFRRGLVVNLSNPKVMLFFVAFLPQFLGSATSPVHQLLVLGVVFQLIGLVLDLAVGWTAGAFRDRILRRPAALRAMTYISAAVFLILAVTVAVQAVHARA